MRTLSTLVVLLAMATGLLAAQPERTGTATFAAGCFWCVEEAFDKVAGVLSTTSGYIGGNKPAPTYKEVSSGTTGHVEAVEVVYDPSRVSYAELLETYWRNVDPLDADGQFCDKGTPYRPVIFYHSLEQRKAAEASMQALQRSGRFDEPIVVAIEPATRFWPAEEYHQDYHQKNPLLYRFYVTRCGRYDRLDQLWSPR